MNLSERLQTIVAMIPQTEVLIDVGSDHAYVPIAAIQQGKCYKAIAGDLRQLPCEQSRKHIESYGLQDKIAVRLGDGLTVVAPGEVNGAVIAGMGGGTILTILQQAPHIVEKLEFLVLQPQGSEAEVRHFLQQNRWRIIEENLVCENGLIYQIILARPGVMPKLTNWEAKYGPINLKKQTSLLKGLVRADIDHLGMISVQMSYTNKESVKAKRLQLLAQREELKELLKIWSE